MTCFQDCKSRWRGYLMFFSVVILCLGSGAQPGSNPSDARNIILFIGDGMHLMHEIAASRYLTGQDDQLSFHRFPRTAYVTTWDTSAYDRYAWWLNAPAYTESQFDPFVGYHPVRGGAAPFPHDRSGSDAYFLTPLFPYGRTDGRPGVPATDSASSATALATGHKTASGRIAWCADGSDNGALATIAEMMRARKNAAIGVVSTVPFSHATPAAFVSHNVSRGNVYTGRGGYDGLGIADEIITRTKPEVVIGGGHPNWDNPAFETNRGYLSKGLYDALKTSSEYVFVERREGVDGGRALAEAAAKARAESKKLFGLFGGEGGCFDPAKPNNSPGAPQVTQGSTENPTLGQASVAALTVLSANENGFFLMCEQGDIDWANHANDFAWMIGAVWDLHDAVQAVVDYIDRPGDLLDWENTLLLVTSDHGNSYMRLNPDKPLGPGELPAQEKSTDIDGQEERGFRYPGEEVRYGTFGHTNELVTLYGRGRGSEWIDTYAGRLYPGSRILDNTEVFHVMAQAAGLDAARSSAP